MTIENIVRSPIMETSRKIAAALSERWPNMQMEGWDDVEAEATISFILEGRMPTIEKPVIVSADDATDEQCEAVYADYDRLSGSSSVMRWTECNCGRWMLHAVLSVFQPAVKVEPAITEAEAEAMNNSLDTAYRYLEERSNISEKALARYQANLATARAVVERLRSATPAKTEAEMSPPFEGDPDAESFNPRHPVKLKPTDAEVIDALGVMALWFRNGGGR